MWNDYAAGMQGMCLEFDEAALMGGRANVYLLDMCYEGIPPLVDAAVLSIALDQYFWNRYKDPHPESAREAWQLLKSAYVALVGTKPIDYGHEAERRLIVPADDDDQACAVEDDESICDGEGLLFAYPAHAVRRVIIGEYAPEASVKAVNTALKTARVSAPVVRAVRDAGTYDVSMVQAWDA